MVPFDTQSPFVTSGIRVGTPAMTTRGLKEKDMVTIVDMIDKVIMNHDKDTIIDEVKKYSNGKNITDSLIIALEDWIALQKLKNLNSLVLETPLSFERNFSAEKARKLNQKR